MAVIDSNTELSHLLEKWEKDFMTTTNSPISLLEKISELIEKETESYIKTDPDPFDDRHPSRARPDCCLGVLLKNLFKNDEFMNKLVNNYLMSRDDFELQTASCRLMLDILPGLETSVVFNETEGLVQRLFSWAESAKEPLQSYATGLLAAAMEVQDIAVNFKEQNTRLVPIMMNRLKELSKESTKENVELQENEIVVNLKVNSNVTQEILPKSPNRSSSLQPLAKKRRLSSSYCGLMSPPQLNSECSNSSWAEVEPYMIGSFQMYPLTPEMKQRFILQYLIPMGDYQELLCHVFEQNALSLILHYINLNENHDIRLAFEALKYLASLLCHKKFASEFLNVGGLQKLLQVYRPSVAATGVSICLYYLAYNEDAMEIICSYPTSTLQDLVSYVLWLLECSHDSSRCHATMFFSLSFAFRKILDLFDSQDGLRKLMNVLFRLNILVDGSDFTDDELFTKRQTARHVCVALKRYYEAHLVIESEHLRRSASSSSSTSSASNIARNKAARYSSETIEECTETLLQMMPLRFNWKPVDELLKLDGVKHLVSLIAVSFDWNYTGKAETIKSALDVLVVCSVCPKFQLVLTGNIEIDEGHSTVAMRIILAAAEAEMVADADVQRSALHVIINCVCGPLTRIGCTYGRQMSGSTKKKSSFRSGEDLLSKLWNCVRTNNGIMILLNLLTVKAPITDADSIRALACKALCGLARHDTVKQIISKLPLFTSGQLQALMKEPILQDKRSEHIKFCKYCIELIERVTGSPLSTNIDTSPANITKAEVVAQTKITYNDKEVLQLIHQYLSSKSDSIEGLSETASSLQRVLQRVSPTHSRINTPSNQTFTTQRISRQIATSNTSSSASQSISHSQHSNTPTPSLQSIQTIQMSNHQTTPTTPLTPIRIHRSSSITKSNNPFTKNFAIEKSQVGSYQPSPVLKRSAEANINQQFPPITLDSIITEYLRKQHALCKNPVVTCPPFSLFVPHRCPEPLNRKAAPLNMAVRLQKREIFPRFGGFYGTKFDRKFIYSRFRPVRTYRDAEGGSSFTSCAFSYVDQFLFLGTASGDLAAFNLHTGALEATYNCHDSAVTYIEPSRDGKLIITCSIFRHPVSALWTFTDLFEMKTSFGDDDYVEFSKQTQDKALGTHNFTAHLYDLNTEQLIRTFEDENLSNRYTKNKATLNPTDELLLNDGVLWDVRTSAHIHKFDKFNQSINGVFHPNGWEIISNSEVWDLRTYHLLKTVPALDQCRIKFNQTGDVIYGAMFEEETSEDEEHNKSPYGSSFRTFDSSDYSNIATIDVKRNIFDLAVDPGDCFVAVVENQSNRDVLGPIENEILAEDSNESDNISVISVSDSLSSATSFTDSEDGDDGNQESDEDLIFDILQN
ncbi:protein VPRBP-like isoform X2 [Dinothrombium tinctorium]|uniref:DDB1- and CUL4-associated factor 1 n=1 Tax=Dinothrombium tinctorium TaxID=1965070 RepID=A0A3S3P8X5_9ACAR|nr:protein VPRBP-like isoform X2 [Dinothrombium tinctorium]RWS14767.1 protein VPRBP-like isoform X2 [Dinothrombium tinctorium]RWS14869.1 protein VPRBP-like isoform X2 [Dinothrombium tinctorium]